MIAQKAQNDPQKVLEEMEKERQEMEEMFTIRAGEADKLREQEVLRKNAIAFWFNYFNFGNNKELIVCYFKGSTKIESFIAKIEYCAAL